MKFFENFRSKIVICSVFLLLLLAREIAAKSSKFPDPMDVMKNIPPPTVKIPLKKKLPVQLSPKPAVNASPEEASPKKEEKKKELPIDIRSSATAKLPPFQEILSPNATAAFKVTLPASATVVAASQTATFTPFSTKPPHSASQPFKLTSGEKGSSKTALATESAKFSKAGEKPKATEMAKIEKNETASATAIAKKMPEKSRQASQTSAVSKLSSESLASATDSESLKDSGKVSSAAALVSVATQTTLFSENSSETAQASNTSVGTAPLAVAASSTEMASSPAQTPPEESGNAAQSAAGVSPDVLAKAEELLKSQKWKELKGHIDANPSIAEDKRGAQIKIECLMNQPKVIATSIKEVAENLLQKDPKDPYANWGMGYYYLESKKPDLDKALKHLSIAKSAKQVPAGVSGLYWKTTLKKRWLLLLLALGGLIAVGDAVRKKRKKALAGAQGETAGAEGVAPAATASTAAESGQTTASAAPTVPETGLKKAIRIVKSLIEKIRRKPQIPQPTASGGEPPAPDKVSGEATNTGAGGKESQSESPPTEASPASTQEPPTSS